MKTIAVVPALNCERTISGVVNGLKPIVDEVIVVDDGSIDKTKYHGHVNGATVISHDHNMGLGQALRTGFKKALSLGADIVVTLDGDGQHEPSDVNKVLDLLINNHCDMVIGSRLLDKKHRKNFPFSRLIGNLILTHLTNAAIGKESITDSQSGYRALRREVLEKIKLTSNRMEISSEIVFEVARNGFRIKEVPIKATYEGEVSNQRFLIDPAKIIFMLIRKSWFFLR